MKILHVIPSTNSQGGGLIEGVKQLYVPLNGFGATVEIACCDTPGALSTSAAGMPVVHALGPSKFVYSYSSKFAPWLKKNASRFYAVIVVGLCQYSVLPFGSHWRVRRCPISCLPTAR